MKVYLTWPHKVQILQHQRLLLGTDLEKLVVAAKRSRDSELITLPATAYTDAISISQIVNDETGFFLELVEALTPNCKEEGAHHERDESMSCQDSTDC